MYVLLCLTARIVSWLSPTPATDGVSDGNRVVHSRQYSLRSCTEHCDTSSRACRGGRFAVLFPIVCQLPLILHLSGRGRHRCIDYLSDCPNNSPTRSPQTLWLFWCRVRCGLCHRAHYRRCLYRSHNMETLLPYKHSVSLPDVVRGLLLMFT